MPKIQITDLADLIVLLPYTLGFHPRDSLVVADLSDGLMHGVARMDLADVRTPELAGRCLVPLLRDGAHTIVLIAWEEFEGGATLALDNACRAAAELGLRVGRELLVRDGRFWSSGEGEPAEGRRVPEPSSVTGVAELVALGIAPLPGRACLATLVAATATERVAAVGVAIERRRACRESSWSSASARRDWREQLDRWAHAAPAPFGSSAALSPPSPHRTAVLAVALLDRDWRDGVIAWVCAGSLPLIALPSRIRKDLVGLPRIPEPPDRAHSRHHREEPGDARRPLRLVGGLDVDDLGQEPLAGEGALDELEVLEGGAELEALEVLEGLDDWEGLEDREGSPGRLDGEQARSLLDGLLALCRDLPDDSEDVAAAALTMSAHVAWWLGDGALARTALDRALTVCPGYRLAELFETVVAVGVRPALLA